jgi:hypothetical protein
MEILLRLDAELPSAQRLLGRSLCAARPHRQLTPAALRLRSQIMQIA